MYEDEIIIPKNNDMLINAAIRQVFLEKMKVQFDATNTYLELF